MSEVYEDTIAAVSTAMAPGGIGIVRISGKEAFSVGDQIYRGKNGKTVTQIGSQQELMKILKEIFGVELSKKA